ncbi:MAG: hypothetical protein NVS2B4_02980 [Ramlibacter sp.]
MHSGSPTVDEVNVAMLVEPDSLEKIERLTDGTFVACYTLRCGQAFTAYAKLFAFEPDSAWDARGAHRKIAAGPLSTAQEALEAVISRAAALIEKP